MSENKEPTTQGDISQSLSDRNQELVKATLKTLSDQNKELANVILKTLSDQNKELVKAVEKLEKEVFYNRLVFTLFFLAAMFYIDLKVGRLGDVIGVLIEMFMPS